MPQYGTFYVVTAKHGVRPNRLKKFLLTEWFTALQSASDCLDVELWQSQRRSGRYLVFELWESKEDYLQNSEKLWKENLRIRIRDFSQSSSEKSNSQKNKLGCPKGSPSGAKCGP